MTERNYIWCCLSLHCHFQRECVYANMIIGSLHFISALSLCVNNVLQHCNFFNLSLGKHTKCQIGTSTFGKMLSVSSQQLHVSKLIRNVLDPVWISPNQSIKHMSVINTKWLLLWHKIQINVKLYSYSNTYFLYVPYRTRPTKYNKLPAWFPVC